MIRTFVYVARGVALGALSLLALLAPHRVQAAPVVGPGAIVASVRDSAGKPVASALVLAEGPTAREATTSAAGLVTLMALPLGTYSVRVTRSGYEPSAAHVKLASARDGPQLVRLRLTQSSFGNLGDPAPAQDIALDASLDTYVSHALVAAQEADVVPVGSAAGSAPALQGTSPNETRIELDDIPLAGGSATYPALRFRNAVALADIELRQDPALPASSLRNAIGGIVNYRTPTFDGTQSAGAVLGYDSTFGAFQHARAMKSVGKLDVLADAVTGGGENRSQTLKLRYALSSATSLAFARYGSQTVATVEGSDVRSLAPATALDLHTQLGAGSLQARVFESVARTSAVAAAQPNPAPIASQVEDARSRGVQLAFNLPLGANAIGVAFDRRGERFANPTAAVSTDQTFTTLSVRTALRLSSRTRVQLADAYAGGTLLHQRHDPQVAFEQRLDDRTALRLSAGSAYATAPDDVLSRLGGAAAATLLPETSFGYRLGLERTLAGGDRVWSSFVALRRLDRFAVRADARTLGFDLGWQRAPSGGRLGVLAYVEARHVAFSGALQPVARQSAEAPLVTGTGSLGGAPGKARLALSLRANAYDISVGTTLLAAGNPLRAGPLALGDAALRVSLGGVLSIRAGLQNAFGQRVTDSRLAPLFTPREVTLTLGRLSD